MKKQLKHNDDILCTEREDGALQVHVLQTAPVPSKPHHSVGVARAQRRKQS